jgi:hypothetical protein
MSKRLTLTHEELDHAYFDPFAGDDEAWAREDIVETWIGDAVRGAADHVGFFRALFLVIALSVLGWAALGALAFELCQLLVS